MHLPVTFGASLLIPTISARFSAAIVAASAIWSTARVPTCCSLPNSDACTLSPSTTAVVSQTKLISRWGSCSDEPLHSTPRRFVFSVVAIFSRLGARRRTQRQGATHDQRTPGKGRFQTSGLAYSSRKYTSSRSPASEKFENPPAHPER